MVTLFVIAMAVSLAHVSSEADAIEAGRTRAAVTATVEAQVRQMTVIAEDNAVWDDAARAVYGGLTDTEFLWGAWGVVTAEARAYQTVIVLDAGGKPLLAYRRGREARIDPDTYGGAFDALIRELKAKGRPNGGLIASPEGPQLAGASLVLPTSRALDGLVPRHGASILVFMRPFDEAAAHAVGSSLVLKDVMLGHASSDRASVTIKDSTGQPVLTLSWLPPGMGIGAIKRALPYVLAIGLLHLAIGAFVAIRAWRSMRSLANQALMDSLSRLPNRRALRAALSQRLSRGQKLALAMIDLDGFKGINDIYGHGVGDRLIKAISAMLADTAGKHALVARLGGDEFAILVGGGNATADIEDIARAILGELSRPFRIDERTVFVGASIGLASAGVGSFDASELMRRADVAMYTAKTAGKMRLTWFDEMLDQKQTVAWAIESELRDAIESEAFEIAYQPVVSAASQKIVGVESLLRWESPTRGLVPTRDFIDVAQETGLIDSIGKIALRKALLDALAWPELFLSVNMSSAQLRNPCFAADLAAILTETGFPAQRLELELNETFLVYDAEMARRVLAEVRALGVGLALDDFGSGFSAVGHLRLFPFGKVKIDRTLVNAACNNDTSRVILQAGITVARALDLHVAAEGIETGEHRDMMRIAGCDLLQGWLYSKPGPADQIAERIARDYREMEAAAG